MIKKIRENKIIKKILNKETLLYLLFGVLTTILSYVVYSYLVSNQFNEVIANTIATIIAVIFAFVTNKIFVFESKSYGLSLVSKELLKFGAARLLTMVIENSMLAVLVYNLLVDKYISKIITSFVVILLNYLFSKKAVFIKK